ncbi:cobyric acid synthase [Alicyclobacillus sp.]|uniref:cobyric acid synthase n=1 Tax=Alicyclobacillus sp. TaxID=61169 RepID=UPI0025C667ED|nr:cobyric acid synthase [Alicyclobacillus sp.]MCL6518001.1 cobyric acid synthase [Alicyclobacillus sp.]
MARSLMVLGTASNVGKSVLCTALCRILAQDGYRVAPFKAQNMSLNSAATPSGREIGRAQAVQAMACGILPNEHMNPVLLKPMQGHRTQVVLQGRVYETTSAREYLRDRLGAVWAAVLESHRYLAQRYEVLVMEGAGSPVEMNLKPRDIANLRMAEAADADVILAADIDRGGVFAAVVGTLHLMTERERARVMGVVINKFRGDPALFEDGVRLLESYTGVPVLGVIPYIPHLNIEAEDSVALEPQGHPERREPRPGDVRVAIVQLPHIANFTDFDPLFLEPGVFAWFCRRPEDLAGAHAVILPGSKFTMRDLMWLRETGMDRAVAERLAGGADVVGVCGGYQMLGRRVADPLGAESDLREMAGLGWLPVVTTMAAKKRTLLVEGELQGVFPGIGVAGYEIHMGRTDRDPGVPPFARVRRAGAQPLGEAAGADGVDGPAEADGVAGMDGVAGADGVDGLDGAVGRDGRVMGTYLHGIFDNDGFRRAWLARLRSRFGLPEPAAPPPQMAAVREAALDRLADVVRAHLRMDVIYRRLGPPGGSTAAARDAAGLRMPSAVRGGEGR